MPTVLITGANQGIGLEFARQYAHDGWRVVATCRKPDIAADLRELAAQHEQLSIEPLDVTNHAAIDALAQRYENETIDVLLNNAGMIGPNPVGKHIHRQHFGTIDYDMWDDVVRTNTFGPVKMAEAFLDQVAGSAQKKIITISSTVGSIEERNTPAFAYATTKAAVNKAMKVLASHLHDLDVIVALLCPGRVKTRMDFGSYDADIKDSVAGMRGIIDAMTLERSGTFTRFNGESIAW